MGCKGSKDAPKGQYARKYESPRAPPPPPPHYDEFGSRQESIIVDDLSFVPSFGREVRERNKSREYLVLVERSDNMKKAGRWLSASKGVQKVVEAIGKYHPRGATLIFCDDDVSIFYNVTTAATVGDLFRKHAPRGKNCLDVGLRRAFREHFDGSVGASSLLVVTSCVPEPSVPVAAAIKKASNSVASKEELSVTFVQLGDDDDVEQYFSVLSSSVAEVQHRILDTLTRDEMNRLAFPEAMSKLVDADQ